MGQSERLYAGKHPIPPLHPMLWTVVGIAPGVGPTGRGAGPPLPCLSQDGTAKPPPRTSRTRGTMQQSRGASRSPPRRCPHGKFR